MQFVGNTSKYTRKRSLINNVNQNSEPTIHKKQKTSSNDKVRVLENINKQSQISNHYIYSKNIQNIEGPQIKNKKLIVYDKIQKSDMRSYLRLIFRYGKFQNNSSRNQQLSSVMNYVLEQSYNDTTLKKKKSKNF